MRAILFLSAAVLLTLAACTTQPLFPENVSDNATPNLSTDVSTPLHTDAETEGPDVRTPSEAEPSSETERDRDAYAAVITKTEGDRIALDTKATDPDGDEVTIAFGEPFDADGVWQTERGDAGEYEVVVTASDGKDATEALLLVVVQPANLPPVITGPTEFSVVEGETVDLGVLTITDPDGDEFVTSYAGWMQSSTYKTTHDDAGTHRVRVIAEDTEGNHAEHAVTVTVENVNRKPRLTIEDRSIEAVEGDRIEIEAEVVDPDGDEVTIAFGEPFDADGVWQTEEGDAGEYEVDVTASDGEDETSRIVAVTVAPANRPPVITVEERLSVEEGETIDLARAASIEDPDGDDVEISYSGWMTSAMYETAYDDAGEYEVTITASDGKKTVSETVTIVVENVNRPPVFVRPA